MRGQTIPKHKSVKGSKSRSSDPGLRFVGVSLGVSLVLLLLRELALLPLRLRDGVSSPNLLLGPKGSGTPTKITVDGAVGL